MVDLILAIASLNSHGHRPMTDLNIIKKRQNNKKMGIHLVNKYFGLCPLSGKKSYRKISWSLDDNVALKFDRHLGSTAADVPVKFQSDCKSLNTNLAPWRTHEIVR